MRHVIALALVLAASPAAAAHCPHGQFYRVSMGKCVALGSPLALAYAPTHPQRLTIVLPADPEPPLKPSDISLTVPDADPDIIDIPLTDPDPAVVKLKLELEKK